MNHVWNILGFLIGAGIVIYFAREIGKGLESVIVKALNATVVAKLDEILDRLDTLERKGE
jgi:hypothetical protein